MRSVGIALIIIGVVALIYTGFTFTTKEKVLDAGPIEINKEKKHAVNWPPVAGALLLAAGIVLIVLDKKK
jgi:hypothetical protein